MSPAARFRERIRPEFRRHAYGMLRHFADAKDAAEGLGNTLGALGMWLEHQKEYEEGRFRRTQELLDLVRLYPHEADAYIDLCHQYDRKGGHDGTQPAR